MFKEFDPQELANLRLTVEGYKEELKNLFTNCKEEFSFDEWSKELNEFQGSIASFDFFFPRKIYQRAENEINHAVEIYCKILN